MGPKKEKKGPSRGDDTYKDRLKSVSETQVNSPTSANSVANFVDEFNAICTEEQTTIVPEIVVITNEHMIVQKKSSDVVPTEEPLSQHESFHDVEVKHNIYVAFENPEKFLNLKQMQFKDSPLDTPLIKTFGRVICNNPTVSVLRLENCRLTSEQLELLTGYILESKTISDLNLDRNPIPAQNYYILLEKPTMINHLSLRLCNIDDQGAALLAHQLEFSNSATQKLISLNLSLNRITHLGAQYLGNALRTNRSLFSLSLAGNYLKDEGAILLASPLGKFELTHEEVVKRRRRNLVRIKEREELVAHYMNISKSPSLTVGGKGSMTRQGSPIKSKRASVEASLQHTASPKEEKKKKFGSSRESRSSTKVLTKSNTRMTSGTPSSVSVPTHTTTTEEKATQAAERRRIELLVEQQMVPDNHPYSTDVWPERLTLFCHGNLHLAHLNLAYNGIGSKGLNALYASMRDQEEILLLHDGMVHQGGKGVMRLALQGNPIPAVCSETLEELQDLIAPRLQRSLNASMLSSKTSNTVSAKSSKSFGKSTTASRHSSARVGSLLDAFKEM